jgi:hypothetical protein
MSSIRDELLALSRTPAPPALATVIREHLREIEAALRAGRRYSEIVDLLRPHGLTPSVEIFRKTLARIRREVEPSSAPDSQPSDKHSRRSPKHLSLAPTPAAPTAGAELAKAGLRYLDPAARHEDIEQWFSAPKPNPLFGLTRPAEGTDRDGPS